MISVLDLEGFDISPISGFLSSKSPLLELPDPYFRPWEVTIKSLQDLILSRRLHETIDCLPLLETSRLCGVSQWRRAYSILAFLVHAYIWADDTPRERIPPNLAIPFLSTCRYLELPPVATYAGLVLWNWKPISHDEPFDSLSNLAIVETFTGSMDEKWFYLISVAIELKGASLIPLMLDAMQAAEEGDESAVTRSLCIFAERVDELVEVLGRMHDKCDPHVFYHHLRPFLAGSKNMHAAGLPNGVVFDNGGPMNKQRYVQFSGGSNAQSSLIQFFDLALGVQHRPTVQKSAMPDIPRLTKTSPSDSNFIHEMRAYMPGPHARFLQQVSRIANIRHFVEARPKSVALTVAFDASLAMLSAFRDKHLQIVSRYILVPKQTSLSRKDSKRVPQKALSDKLSRKDLRGTGGTALIPFLRQAREETAEPAIEDWARRIMDKKWAS